MPKLNVLKLTGTPYDFGYQHGLAYRDAIHHFTEERVHLSSDPNWTGATLSRAEVLALGEACLEEHRRYAPELVEELQGMADATGLGLAELVIMNGFTDFVDVVYSAGQQNPAVTHPIDDCTAFLVPASATAEGYGFFGQTWDMHATATPYVILIEGQPTHGIPFLSFSTTGCVGMIGMNKAGIAVGINNIMGGDGQVGVTWPFVVRKILAQETLEAALACITEAKLAGAHNYVLLDKHGRGYNVEAMATRQYVEALDEQSIVHTNHCVYDINRPIERERPLESLQSSQNRFNKAHELLTQRPITEQHLMDLTREESTICLSPKPPLHVETCGAAIMRPATGDFWAIWGKPTEGEYERFVL